MLVKDDTGNVVAHLAMSTLENPEQAATVDELEALLAGEKCPKCGAELLSSFGLMGGGYGPMVICDNLDCGFIRKHDLGPDAE